MNRYLLMFRFRRIRLREGGCSNCFTTCKGLGLRCKQVVLIIWWLIKLRHLHINLYSVSKFMNDFSFGVNPKTRILKSESFVYFHPGLHYHLWRCRFLFSFLIFKLSNTFAKNPNIVGHCALNERWIFVFAPWMRGGWCYISEF